MANLLQQFVETMKSPESVFLQYSRLTSLTLSVLCGQESKHHDLATRGMSHSRMTATGGIGMNNRRRYICRNIEQ